MRCIGEDVDIDIDMERRLGEIILIYYPEGFGGNGPFY